MNSIYNKFTELNIVALVMIISLAGCKRPMDDITEISTDDIIVNLQVDSNSIIFKEDFDVTMVIENNTGRKIEIDTSPDEVIEAPSEEYGGVYKNKGSFFHITVTQDQDENGQFDFFCTNFIKIPPQNNSVNSFTIPSGKSHKLTFTLSPWGPVLGSLPSEAQPGPAEKKASLLLIINGQSLNIETRPIQTNFISA